jgi:hypothetical protein
MNFAVTLVIGLVMVAGAFLLGYFIGRFGEAMVDSSPEAKKVRYRMAVRAKLEQRFEQRCAELESLIEQSSSLGGEFRKRRASAEQKLAQARQRAAQPVRLLGDERTARIRFAAQVVNRQVQRAEQEGAGHASLDASWSYPQAVEIWADNLQDARREVARVYPAPQGYQLLSMHIDLSDAEKDKEVAPL